MNAQPIIPAPLEVLYMFLPFELRKIRRTGIQLSDLQYWHEDLSDLVGFPEPREIHYDPRDVSRVYVRASDGVVRVVPCVTHGIKRISLYELKEGRRRRLATADDPAQKALRDAGIEVNDDLVKKSKTATRAAHRKTAREEERGKAVEHTDKAVMPDQVNAEPPETDISLDPSVPLPVFDVEHWGETHRTLNHNSGADNEND